MVYLANNQLKPEIMRMWKRVFNDSDEFMKMYFRTKYKNENTLVKIQDGKIVSSLQMLPYSINFYDDMLPVAYISGAMTLPEARKKGYMEELLAASFTEMKKRNIPITTLIPQENWLFNFYEKYGYTSMFDVRKQLFDISSLNVSATDFVQEATFDDVIPIANYCNNILSKQPLAIQKTNADWQAVFEDNYLANGKIFYWKEHQVVKGIGFALENDENEVTVKGLLADNEEIKGQLLTKIAQAFQKEKIFVIAPSNEANAKPFGMARIIDVRETLSIYAQHHPQLNFSIHITDNHADWNNKFFQVNEGKCSEIRPQPVDFDVTINLFTQLTFGYRISSLPEKYRLFPEKVPQMSLMLE